MTCRWWFSPSACFLLARNKFPLSLTLDILFKLDRGGWMPNRKWPSKMQINLWGNLFVYLLYVPILNLWHCVYHKNDLAVSFFCCYCTMMFSLHMQQEIDFLCFPFICIQHKAYFCYLKRYHCADAFSRCIHCDIDVHFIQQNPPHLVSCNQLLFYICADHSIKREQTRYIWKKGT